MGASKRLLVHAHVCFLFAWQTAKQLKQGRGMKNVAMIGGVAAVGVLVAVGIIIKRRQAKPANAEALPDSPAMM